MPAKRDPSLGSGRRAKSVSNNRARGATRPPDNPTGRLVTTAGVQGGAQTSHWCPDAVKSGTYNWKCPECGVWFAWSVDRSEWYAVTDADARGGRSA